MSCLIRCGRPRSSEKNIDAFPVVEDLSPLVQLKWLPLRELLLIISKQALNFGSWSLFHPFALIEENRGCPVFKFYWWDDVDHMRKGILRL